MTHLRELWLNVNSVSDLSPLAGLTHLRVLGFDINPVSDLSPLARLTRLTFLSLVSNSVSDLSPLAGLTHLEVLDLRDNPVSDLSPLAELNDLTNLEIDGNLVSDLSPLVANTGLGDGDVIEARGNPLSYASVHTHIPILLERGVEVNHDNRAHPALLKISGYNQQGSSGVPLAQPFVVAVQDENGSAVEGVQVTFTVTEGGGTLSSTTSTTDANGQAATTLTLGSDPGPNTVSATVAGLEPETFTAIGQATADSDGDDEQADDEQAMPQSLTKVSGEGQAGQAGTTLAEPFVVSVLDQNGSAYAGAVVTFSVTAGGGTLSATTATTNASGQARSTLTLGSDPGPNTVSATVEGLEPVTFTATAIGQDQTPVETGEDDGEEDDGEIADDESSGEDQPESEEQPTSTVALEGISASHDSVREDDGQATTITLTVTLDKAATADETITLAIISPTQGKTAKRNEDFEATMDETLTIAEGQKNGDGAAYPDA